ncbi:MAG: TonB-dependent receptor [Pseudomonadota bacterium]
MAITSQALSRRARLFLSSVAFFALTLSGAIASAQEAPSSDAEIIVTGTSIRGVAPTGSNLISMSREAIVTTSAATTTDLFRKIPALSGFNSAPSIRADAMDSINLPSIHGLPGAGLVLVLFDGYRAVGSGIDATSPDPSSIAPAAIERIEVIPDGASATYGSDAVTGVINLVMRRNLNGLEAQARYGFADDYSRYDASFGAGRTWDGGHVLFSYQYTHNTKLMGRDRSDFYGLNQTGRAEADGTPGTDWRKTTCDPGTVYVGAGAVSYAAAGAGVPFGAAGSKRLCDYVGDNSLIPKDTRNNVVVTAHQDLAPNVELWGQAFYALHEAQKDSMYIGYTGLTINNTNPYFQAPPGTGATSEKLDFSARNILGGRSLHDDLRYRTITGRAGVIWKINSNWQAKFTGTTGTEKDLLKGQKQNNDAFLAALVGTTPTTALNPFGANNPAVISALGNYKSEDYDITQKLHEGLVNIDGSLFHIAGGDVKLAFGGSVRKETFQGAFTGGTATSRFTVAKASNDRTITAEYAELFVPLVGADNAMPGIRRLELAASVRHDDYDDVGSTTNPKYGINWEPIGGLTLRGSYSTSFHAPSIADNTNQSIDAHAQAFCCIFGPPNDPTPVYTVIKNGGNSSLKPETSKNYTFGFDAAPEAVKGLRFGASYFHVAFVNQIGYLPPPALYTPAASAYYVFHPTRQQELDFIAGYPIGVNDINGGALPGLLLDLRRNNLGKVTFAGVDFNASYTMPLRGGDFTIGLDGTRLTKYETVALTGSPPINELGTGTGLLVHPIRWQARANVGWSNDLIQTQVYFSHTGYYRFYANNVYHPVRAFTPIDLHFGVTPFKSAKLKNTQFTLDVDNVFDQSPPYVNEGTDGDNAGNGYDKRAANPLGRVITFGVRAAF